MKECSYCGKELDVFRKRVCDECNNSNTEIRKREYAKNYRIKYRYKVSKSSAKSRGKNWELTEEEYNNLIFNNCTYCDSPIGTGIGLDRKDNSIGYILNNVVPCCRDCNMIKSNILTFDEMLVAMRAVTEYRKSI